MNLATKVVRGADPYADAEATRQALETVGKIRVKFDINETDTLAGTSAELVSPVDGTIKKLVVIVQKAVTTGGPVTVLVGTTTVAGLSVTIADGATKGTVVTDTTITGDGTEIVKKDGRIQIAPDAAFATAGAISGWIEIEPD